MDTYLFFILQLRCVCETIFDVILSASIAGVKTRAYHNRLKEEGSSFEWDNRALRSAELAQTDTLHECGDIPSADGIAKGVLVALRTRYYFHSSARLIFPHSVSVQELC